jgi:hypothetical protein
MCNICESIDCHCERKSQRLASHTGSAMIQEVLREVKDSNMAQMQDQKEQVDLSIRRGRTCKKIVSNDLEELEALLRNIGDDEEAGDDFMVNCSDSDSSPRRNSRRSNIKDLPPKVVDEATRICMNIKKNSPVDEVGSIRPNHKYETTYFHSLIEMIIEELSTNTFTKTQIVPESYNTDWEELKLTFEPPMMEQLLELTDFVKSELSTAAHYGWEDSVQSLDDSEKNIVSD